MISPRSWEISIQYGELGKGNRGESQRANNCSRSIRAAGAKAQTASACCAPGRGLSHQFHVLERIHTYGRTQVCSKGHQGSHQSTHHPFFTLIRPLVGDSVPWCAIKSAATRGGDEVHSRSAEGWYHEVLVLVSTVILTKPKTSLYPISPFFLSFLGSEHTT